VCAPFLVSWCETTHSEPMVMLSSWFLISKNPLKLKTDCFGKRLDDSFLLVQILRPWMRSL